MDDRFYLSADTVADIRSRHQDFGFSGFGAVVYYRTYSRLKEDGSQEHWADTVIRVIEGVIGLRKRHHRLAGLRWEEKKWQTYARRMAVSMFNLHWLPPGRGLWAMGTEYVRERGSTSLFNCAAVTTQDLATAAEWSMDLLMCGCGVGYDMTWTGDAKAPNKDIIQHFTIPDSREGWVESVKKLIEAYTKGTPWPVFDYSQIRPFGTPIRGFGGTASGAGPLAQLHVRIEVYLDTFCRGESDATRCTADVVNAIGACVVAGNVRRSAQILLGSPHDETFRNLKNYERYPLRQDIGWLSNNSCLLRQQEDFEAMPDLAQRIRDNGEPGILNMLNIGRFGRFGRDMEDPATLINPCQPASATVLGPRGIRTIGDLQIGDQLWSEDGWVTVTNKVCTGIKPVFEYRTSAGCFLGTENHRVLDHGIKLEVKDAKSIDTLQGSFKQDTLLNPQAVLDGLVIGDGSSHTPSGDKVYLTVGRNDQDYYDDQDIGPLVVGVHAVKKENARKVITSITPEELPPLPERQIPERYFKADSDTVASFLRGLYSANGSVVASRVTLKAVSRHLIDQVQMMLSSIGIRAYVTTNKASEVVFENGTYLCKESYDLNICPDRWKFRERIGFIQKYKAEKLDRICDGTNGKGKTTFAVTQVTPLGVAKVYDITVDGPHHTYWTGGLNVSNCSEIPLESFEVCCLSEVFPTKCVSPVTGELSEEAYFEALEFATFYASTVLLLPTHRPETNEVITRNRRIGVSISGAADWLHLVGATKMTRLMRDGYRLVRTFNRKLAKEAGVPQSIRLTTVKPSGSISQLSGVSSGMHFPTFKYAIRRVRVGDATPICDVLKNAGVPNEPDQFSERTTVFEFPIHNPHAREARFVSAWEQFAFLSMMQREWADNSVSCTVYFNPETEGHQVEHMLAQFAPVVKSVSLLPHTEMGAYPQMPYQGINEHEFHRLMAKMPLIDWKVFGGSDGQDTKFCTNESCVI